MILVTQIFEREIGRAFEHPDELDRQFQEHLGFVFNQCAQALRKTGLSQQTLEEIGKLLLRLYKVYQAYKAKKTTYTAKEWLEKILELGKEMGALTQPDA